jgi:hypothetical protein
MEANMGEIRRIIPAELEGDALWQHNAEYVAAHHYDALAARIAELETTLRRIIAAVDDPEGLSDDETFKYPCCRNELETQFHLLLQCSSNPREKRLRP